MQSEGGFRDVEIQDAQFFRFVRSVRRVSKNQSRLEWLVVKGEIIAMATPRLVRLWRRVQDIHEGQVMGDNETIDAVAERDG